MSPLNRRSSNPMIANRKFLRPSRSMAQACKKVLASTFALASLVGSTYAPAAKAQIDGSGQICYAVGDNNPPGNGDGGISFDDTLARIDFGAGFAEAVDTVRRPNGAPIRNIEAMSSRTDFNELIAANGNEIGRIDPETGVFTSLGALTPFQDFDAIVIDRTSPNQADLLGVSKGGGSLNNVLIEATLILDDSGQSIGISAPRTVVTIPSSAFPPDTDSIDGIAVSENNVIFGVANRGPRNFDDISDQVLVIIDPVTGALDDRGVFIADGEEIDDVEDLSFDLFGNLFASSGSNFNRFTDNAFIFPLSGDGNLSPASKILDLTPTGAGDFEASACLQFSSVGSMLVVKRITAITRNGEETQFDDFLDQEGELADNELFQETGGAFPLGIVQAPTTLSAGDQVEYTVYIYNPTPLPLREAVLCDAIQLPSILQSDSIEFADPTDNLTLTFNDEPGFARAPLATADDACAAVLDGGDQFLAGPPGPLGGLDVGAGGGVITDTFTLEPDELAAARFTITVGAADFDE
ncbi:MAG: hypothetical protein AAFQ40_03460 [Cyanobacteria bacterium J06623_5]